MTDSGERDAAVALMWLVLERVANAAECRDVEAWIDARSEDEGGFLWLIGQLGCRSRPFESRLRELVAAEPAQRGFLLARVRAARKALAKAHAS